MTDKSQLIATWREKLKEALDYDKWGQVLESSEIYIELSRDISSKTDYNNDIFTKDEIEILRKISACFIGRHNELLSTKCSNYPRISLADIKAVAKCVNEVGLLRVSSFPVSIEAQALGNNAMNVGIEDITALAHRDGEDESPSDDDNDSTGACQPAIRIATDRSIFIKETKSKGHTLLTVRVCKFGMKKPKDILDPYITLSVKDITGSSLTPSQDTPVAEARERDYLHFNCDIEIQQSVEDLRKNSTLFFELKHYKVQKRGVSLKSWAFMEGDEIKEGEVLLEVYKRPIDYKKKKLHLVTTKDLFIHLELMFHRYDDSS